MLVAKDNRRTPLEDAASGGVERVRLPAPECGGPVA